MLQFEERRGLRRDGVRTACERRRGRGSGVGCDRGNANSSNADSRDGDRGSSKTAGCGPGSGVARDIECAALGRRERRRFCDTDTAYRREEYRLGVDSERRRGMGGGLPGFR